MNLAEHYAAALGMSVDDFARSAAFLVTDDGATAFQWDEGLLGPKPSDDDLAAVLALPDPAPAASALLAYAAAKRLEVETGGITVNGAPIATDRGSQAMIGNAYAYVQASGAESVSYKATTGFVTLTADQFKAVALAVGAHVQACFAAEAEVDAGINASPATITTFAQIDAVFAALSPAG
jgi:hypothetical protein